MKKVFTVLLMVLTFNLSNAQVETFEIQTENGMDDMVSVKYDLYLSKSPVTLQELLDNKRSQFTKEDIEKGWGKKTNEELLTSQIKLMSFYIKTFKVKHKATWIPKKAYCLWSEKNNNFTVALEGFASNAYGTPGKITGYFIMDINGKLERDPILF